MPTPTSRVIRILSSTKVSRHRHCYCVADMKTCTIAHILYLSLVLFFSISPPTHNLIEVYIILISEKIFNPFNGTQNRVTLRAHSNLLKKRFELYIKWIYLKKKTTSFHYYRMYNCLIASYRYHLHKWKLNGIIWFRYYAISFNLSHLKSISLTTRRISAHIDTRARACDRVKEIS